jgi:hypothetical protein
MGVPSSARVFLVRLNMMGAKTRRTRPKAALAPAANSRGDDSFIPPFSLTILEELRAKVETPEEMASAMELRQNAGSHHGSCLRNLSRPYTSESEFWIGVPVTHQRLFAVSMQQALDTTVRGFLIPCASSRMILPQQNFSRG